MFQNNDAFIVLPKDTGDVKLTMTFRLFVNGTYAADHTLSTTLENAKWEAGQRIIYNLQVNVGEILQGGCTYENWNIIDELTETITDSLSDHDAGKGDLNDEGWSNIEHGWQ